MSLTHCKACGETHDQDRTCARTPLAARAGSADELLGRIRHYLASGGLFNPELADHYAVRDLIMDCRDWMDARWNERSTSAQGTEARVCQDITWRQQRGIAKYGFTVEANPLHLISWLRHAYEECLDQAVYLRRAIEEIEKPNAQAEPRRKDAR